MLHHAGKSSSSSGGSSSSSGGGSSSSSSMSVICPWFQLIPTHPHYHSPCLCAQHAPPGYLMLMSCNTAGLHYSSLPTAHSAHAYAQLLKVLLQDILLPRKLVVFPFTHHTGLLPCLPTGCCCI
jgi:hypothetical protein